MTSGSCLDKIEVHRSGVELGFPLKVITTFHSNLPGQDPKYTNNTSILEVVEFKEAPLDPALFVVPRDFHRRHEIPRFPPIDAGFQPRVAPRPENSPAPTCAEN